MPPAQYLALERLIALAHRVVWDARARANLMSLEGLEHDLEQIAGELQRLQEDLLKSRPTLRRARSS